MPPKVDITDQRFGRWTAIGDSGPSAQGRVWHCKCDCGAEQTIPAKALRAGKRVTCGGCSTRKLWRKLPPDEELLKLRCKGWSTERIAKHFGCHRTGVSVHLGPIAERRYYPWIARGGALERIGAARREGRTWEQIRAQESVSGKCPYSSGEALRLGYATERAKRLESALMELLLDERRQAQEMTAAGLSAAQIASKLGVSQRTVVRWRSAAASEWPKLDLARIENLLGRGLTWGDINERLAKPYEFGQELEVAYHWLMDAQSTYRNDF